MITKKTLYADTVLRRDGGQLYLMNRQEGGFRAWAQPIDDEQWLLDRYHVRVGEWSRDAHGEFCPVTRVPRNELPTLHDGEEVPTLHDFGVRGSIEHSVLASLPSVTETDAIKALMGGHIRAPDKDDEPSKRAYRTFIRDTDWDAIGDALGPDD